MVFELLTEEDKNKIITYIEKYGSLNNGCGTVNDIEVTLAEWNKQKGQLCKMLGNKLIVSRPYTYAISEEGLIREFNQALYENEKFSKMKSWFINLCNQNYNWFKSQFENHNAVNWYLSAFIFNGESLAKNVWTFEGLKLVFPSGHTYKITKGMSLMKLIKKFVDEFDGPQDLFEEFRIAHSMYLNQKYIDGELCLSIHPLDYMTMSDNTYNWSSCMRWMDGGGDYRTGTLECMNSPYIIEAYLHSPKKTMSIHYYSNDITWNSKRWRELFFVNEAVINEIKSYPYQDEHLTNTVLMWIKELAGINLGYTYGDDEININDAFNDEEGNNYFIDYDTNGFMYKDIGTLNKHRARVNIEKLHSFTPWYIYDIEENVKGYEYHFNYGGIATCLNCGKELGNYEDASNRLFCEVCDPSRICPCCGQIIYSDSYYYVEDYEDPICQDCYDNDTTIDMLTGETCMESSTTSIYWFLGYDEYNNKVYYDNTIITRDESLEYNSAYTNVFSETPKREYHKWKNYITLDYVKPNALKDFADYFDISESNLQKIYENYNIATPAVEDLTQFADSGYLDKENNNLFF